MTKRKSFVFFLLLALAAAFLLLSGAVRCSRVEAEGEAEKNVDTVAVLVRQVQQCARLYTAEVNVHKIVTHDDARRLETTLLNRRISLELPLARRKVAIPIDATVKAYVDFAEFSARNVRRNGEKIEIILPDPQFVLTQTKVRNEEIRKQVSLFRSDFSDKELTEYEAKGREEILSSIPKMGLDEKAREGAAKVLVPLIEQLGYEERNIVVTFRKDFTTDELKRLIGHE